MSARSIPFLRPACPGRKAERGFTLITRPVCDSEADKRAYASQRDAEVPEQSLVCVAGDERLDP